MGRVRNFKAVGAPERRSCCHLSCNEVPRLKKILARCHAVNESAAPFSLKSSTTCKPSCERALLAAGVVAQAYVLVRSMVTPHIVRQVRKVKKNISLAAHPWKSWRCCQQRIDDGLVEHNVADRADSPNPPVPLPKR